VNVSADQDHDNVNHVESQKAEGIIEADFLFPVDVECPESGRQIEDDISEQRPLHNLRKEF
jgi:hypothetical protein